MLFKRLHKYRGQSIMEYMFLIVFVIAGLLIFQKYIARGLYGRMKGIGDSVGQGRQYDPATINCAFDSAYGHGWYDADCAYEICGAECYDNSPGSVPDCSCFGQCQGGEVQRICSD